MIAVLEPLRDRRVATLWSGLALASVGAELYSMSTIWIAIDLAGPGAAYVSAAQNAALFFAALFAGALADRWPAPLSMIGSSLARGALVLVPVALWAADALTFPTLIAAVVGVAALRALFDPALQSTVPTLVSGAASMRAVNGLFDATHRLARLVGPGFAAPLSALVPTIHFLSVTAVTFVGAAAAVFVVFFVQKAAQPPRAPARVAGWRAALDGMVAGFWLLRGDPLTRRLVLTNGAINGPWLVGLTLGVPLLIDELNPTLFGLGGFAAYGLATASFGVGDLCGNVVASGLRTRRVLRSMHLGYVGLGSGLALIAASAWFAPPALVLPCMMLAGAVGGFGAPFFFIGLLTRLQTVFHGADIARVFRLRMSLMAANLLAGGLAAPILFETLGIAGAILLCGAAIFAAGAFGAARHWRSTD